MIHRPVDLSWFPTLASLAPYRKHLLTIRGVTRISRSVFSSLSTVCLKSHPSSGIDPRRHTLLHDRLVLTRQTRNDDRVAVRNRDRRRHFPPGNRRRQTQLTAILGIDERLDLAD